MKILTKLSQVISMHPRLPRLIVTRALAASLALSGCVPATSYEEAKSAAEVEREGHRRAAAKLSAAEEELKRVKGENQSLTASKKELEDRLQKEESSLAQTSLDKESAQKAHEQQTELVTQLRGELARVGDHLKSFEGDKEQLSNQLAEAEEKVKLLEGQIEYLKAKAETSADKQAELRGALADLEAMQAAKAEATAAPEEASAAETPEPVAAAEPAAEEPELPGEVMPEPEDESAAE